MDCQYVSLLQNISPRPTNNHHDLAQTTHNNNQQLNRKEKPQLRE